MKSLVMCIGNREGGDDAVGPYIADKLSDVFNVIDCGTSPENYTGVVKKKNPENLIIIDAVEMGLQPGSIRIIPRDKIGVMTISTHGIPISLIIEYLEQSVKKVIFIGIQPEKMSGQMSEVVRKEADNLIRIVTSKNVEKIKVL
jgi:hydrogenase 3 maturation protease